MLISSERRKDKVNVLEPHLPHVNLKASDQKQLEQSKKSLRACMSIRAYIYGLDLTKDLIAFNNKLTAAKRIVEEHMGDYKNFSEASFKEKMKTIGGFEGADKQEAKLVANVPSKYL